MVAARWLIAPQRTVRLIAPERTVAVRQPVAPQWIVAVRRLVAPQWTFLGWHLLGGAGRAVAGRRRNAPSDSTTSAHRGPDPLARTGARRVPAPTRRWD